MLHKVIIVAHRGLSALFPENTGTAIVQAIMAGARAVEFDVQLTADKIPIMFHDATLERMTGAGGSVMQTHWRQIRNYYASYPARFGDEFSDTPVMSLADTIEIFVQHPVVIPCLEIKGESIEYFGLNTCIDIIVKTAEPVLERALFLSFNRDVIESLHCMGISKTGWVLEEYNDSYRVMADSLQPQVLICNINKLPAAGRIFWPGPWEWMVYQTEEPEVVRRYAEYGASYVETDNISVIAGSMPELFSQ